MRWGTWMAIGVGIFIFAARCWAAEGPWGGSFASFSFIQVSDFHLGSNPVIAARIAKIGEIAQSSGASFILVTGDQKPYEPDYLNSLLRANFPVPYFLIPGNHDLEGTHTLAGWREAYGPDYYAFTINNCQFTGIDTEVLLGRWGTTETLAHWDWLTATLAAAPAAGRTHSIVFGHIPPYDQSETEEDGGIWDFAPADRRRFLDLARACGVEAYLGGHLHASRVYGTAPVIELSDALGAGDDIGYGYCYFRVGANRIERRYVALDGTDSGPPSAPAPLSLAPGGGGAALQLEWGASTDDTDVARYVVACDGRPIGTVFEESFTSGTAPAGDHLYSVVAYDMAGNASTAGTFQQTTLLDGPCVEGTGPTTATIHWRTSCPTVSTLRLSRSSMGWGQIVSEPVLTADHHVTMDGLEPGVRYYYAPGSDVQILAQGEGCTFTTVGTATKSGAKSWSGYP